MISVFIIYHRRCSSAIVTRFVPRLTQIQGQILLYARHHTSFTLTSSPGSCNSRRRDSTAYPVITVHGASRHT